MLRLWHRVDDPWSHLLLQVLPRLLATYEVTLECVTLPVPLPDYAPRPDMLARHALRDALNLREHLELSFESNGVLPEAAMVMLANRRLLAVSDPAEYLPLATALGNALFAGRVGEVRALCAAGRSLDPEQAVRRLALNQQRQLAEGHFNTAMLGFGGAWYWGVDRLHHLEHDLLVAGRKRPDASVGLVQRRPMPELPPVPGRRLTLDFYCSFRSPYTYLAGERVFALARRRPVEVRPKLILPMKMAGFVIPELKARYFRFDPAREALRHGMRFGHFHDPFGAGLERAMALVEGAAKAGRLEAYILSVMQGVWADGVDMASDAGLRRLAERAGLDWAALRPALAEEGWRDWAAQHRAELDGHGQYAAPTFVLGDYVTWGQDRIWVLEREIQRRLGEMPAPLPTMARD